jgi:RNA polymerase sigma-70 factor (ECF subfamily)
MIPADSDASLMQRYRDGDSDALRGLFRRHARRLQTFFLCTQKSAEQAEELSQQTWLRLHRDRRGYTPGTPFLPWLYAIAVQLRRDSVRQPVVQASQPGAARAVTDGPSLIRALQDLPDSYREVVVLHRLVALSYPEIAQALGATESAVQQRAQQGYEQLAESSQAAAGTSDAPPEQRGQAVFDPSLLDAVVALAPLEQNARALLPVVARELTPRHLPWPIYAACLFLLSVVALVLLRLAH